MEVRAAWSGEDVRRFWIVAIVVVSLVAGIALKVGFDRLVNGPPADVGDVRLSPNPDSDLTIVAVGDSFMSGEGAASFFEGTNENGNGCRRTWTAYPYQVATNYSADLKFVACSGALVRHVESDGQFPESPAGIAGAVPQIDHVVSAAEDADIVLLSIGGNDAGFGDIVKSCVLGLSPCDHDRDRWLAPLADLEVSLAALYAKIADAAPQARLFVMTYPQPLGPNWCHSSLLDRDEFEFLSEEFIPALNDTITRATARQQVQVIDLANSFAGLRLCEVIPQKAALNRVELPRRHNSFHPNEVGHTLITSMVVRHLLLAGYALPPTNDATSVTAPPDAGTLTDDQDSGTTIAPSATAPTATEPSPPQDTAPTATEPTPQDTAPSATFVEEGPSVDCVAQLAPQIRIDARTTSIRITESAPRSEVCYRIADGDWIVTVADGDGIVDIPVENTNRPLAVDAVFVDRTGNPATLSFLLSE